MDEFSLDDIRQYWTNQAIEHAESPAASWSDYSVIHLEVREMLKYLDEGDRALDIGCANGYSTLRLASLRNLSIRGLDYIPEMIEHARRVLKSAEESLQARVEFDVGDIKDLDEADDSYDKVIVTRVIINLGNWENQERAIQECLRVLKPGGLLMMSEAILQGWSRLNALREEWGLDAIPIPPFNEYLDENQVVSACSSRAARPLTRSCSPGSREWVLKCARATG